MDRVERGVILVTFPVDFADADKGLPSLLLAAVLITLAKDFTHLTKRVEYSIYTAIAAEH